MLGVLGVCWISYIWSYRWFVTFEFFLFCRKLVCSLWRFWWCDSYNWWISHIWFLVFHWWVFSGWVLSVVVSISVFKLDHFSFLRFWLSVLPHDWLTSTILAVWFWMFWSSFIFDWVVPPKISSPYLSLLLIKPLANIIVKFGLENLSTIFTAASHEVSWDFSELMHPLTKWSHLRL